MAGAPNVQIVGQQNGTGTGILQSVVVSTTGAALVQLDGAASISGSVTVTGSGFNGSVPVSINPGGTAATGYAVSVTSGAPSIVITSGANTLYITEVLVSANVAMQVDLRSATTAFATVYLAAQGGFVWPLVQPWPLNSNQSLTFLQSVSGSCAVSAVGFRVV